MSAEDATIKSQCSYCGGYTESSVIETRLDTTKSGDEYEKTIYQCNNCGSVKRTVLVEAE